MNRRFRPRFLVQGLLGAAVAALLGAAHSRMPGLDQGYAVGLESLVTPEASAARVPEWRTASERVPKAPIEQAARTRRSPVTSGSGVLPPSLNVAALGAPVVFIIRGSAELVALPSECGHCTRAPRPPPIS